MAPAVVNINTVWPGATSAPPARDLSGNSDPFAFFDSARRPGRSSLGSGFVISPAGHILTQSRVISDASRISVRLGNGRILQATLIGTDPASDIAVLKVTADGLPSLKLNNSEDVSTGEWVAAFGKPLGAGGIMRAGIICGKTALGERRLLQTDALIDESNTGGPLVNMRGEVVGVNTAGKADSLFKGTAYAIPAAQATKVYEHLLRSGKQTRGWLGLRVHEIEPEVAVTLQLPYNRGVVVVGVYPGGPGARAGLIPGDVITEFSGSPIRSVDDLSVKAAETPVGSRVSLGVLREKQKLYRSVPVGERQSSTSGFLRSESAEPERLGITIQDIDPAVRPHGSTGLVIVIDVEPGSRAEDAGVQQGDIILEANRKRVTGSSALVDLIRTIGEVDTVLLKIARSGRTAYLVL